MKTSDSKTRQILLVDDDRHLLESMGAWLVSLGYRVSLASNLTEARKYLSERAYELALVDLRLGDEDGMDLLAECQKHHPHVVVLLMTGYATLDTGIEAIRAGAFDLMTKPLIDDEILMAFDRALSQQQVLEENEQLKTQLDQRFGRDSIIGNDARMQKTYDMVDSIADTKATVLITGESGTGKSLIARAIHQRSNRRKAPFVEVACGALPENLLESELFGHVAGSFTGATGNKVGKFKQADGGTIFLDEIGTASPGLQVKLLRVLQELEFEQVGGSQTFKVNTRVILATNEDLSQAVAEGRFREDLFYRVNVINIELPSLRERPSDIPMLAQHFLGKVCEEENKQIEGFDQLAMQAMQDYRWPGNVRELQNIVERAVLLGSGPRLGVQDLPAHISASGGNTMTIAPSGVRQSLKQALEGPERQIILQCLRENNWNRNATADQLGVNRTTLYKKMKRLGLEDPKTVALNGW
ncbi:MAG: sigma-54 dependent transcriptional regulator [Mariniblastus sp.]|nr:sigma-54 dependent transcriptional regulator [Mariniblastus sp.]